MRRVATLPSSLIGVRHKPQRLSAGDVNGDGCLDVVSTHEYGEGVTLYYGDGCFDG